MRARKVVFSLLFCALSMVFGCTGTSADCWPDLRVAHVDFYWEIDASKLDPDPARIEAARDHLRETLNQCPADTSFSEDSSLEGDRDFDSFISLIDLAIFADDVALTEKFLSRLDSGSEEGLETRTLQYGGLYLELAAFAESSNVARWLLEHGFDAREPDENGLSALHASQARTIDGLRLISDLVSFGAEIEARAGGTATPLMLARLNGDMKKVQCLLALGAQMPSEDKYDDVNGSHKSPEKVQKIDDFLKLDDRVIPESIQSICTR